MFADPPGSDGVARWTGCALDVPLAFVADRHHGAMIDRPTGDLEMMVREALAARVPADDRGDGVSDFNVQFDVTWESGEQETLVDFASDGQPYTRDPSDRAFHVKLRDMKRSRIAALRLKVPTRTNTSHVGSRGAGGSRTDGWDGALDLSAFGPPGDVKLFWPFTTTLIEIVLDREPRPYSGANEVLWFAK